MSYLKGETSIKVNPYKLLVDRMVEIFIENDYLIEKSIIFKKVNGDYIQFEDDLNSFITENFNDFEVYRKNPVGYQQYLFTALTRRVRLEFYMANKR